MTSINNILICGLGGIGCVFATSISDNTSKNLKILIDKNRWDTYATSATFFNGKPYVFDYILPDDKSFKADLIIIATKDNGLESAIKNIKNFVTPKTIIISLLNGIHSEEKISETYGVQNVLYSFYIGCSCIREGRKITQNGQYNIVIGAKYNHQNDLLQSLDFFLNESKICHYISENIQDEYWKKFIINVGVNQLCAATGKTLKEIKQNEKLVFELKSLMKEAAIFAKYKGIINHVEIYNSAVNFLLNELDDANPSMLQDVKAHRKTEVEIFAGKIIEFGKENGIETPFNLQAYKKIKALELKKI